VPDRTSIPSRLCNQSINKSDIHEIQFVNVDVCARCVVGLEVILRVRPRQLLRDLQMKLTEYSLDEDREKRTWHLEGYIFSEFKYLFRHHVFLGERLKKEGTSMHSQAVDFGW
jgi:hypothetical protein